LTSLPSLSPNLFCPRRSPSGAASNPCSTNGNDGDPRSRSGPPRKPETDPPTLAPRKTFATKNESRGDGTAAVRGSGSGHGSGNGDGISDGSPASGRSYIKAGGQKPVFAVYEGSSAVLCSFHRPRLFR
jgi:hypothetical protein